MSTKNSIHSVEIPNRQPNDRRSNLFGISLILLAALVVTLITFQSRNSQVVNQVNAQPVVYSNALALQYAQPWLDKSQVVAVQYSDALAMQYAHPWLDKQQAAPATFYNNYLELFYAQPWLDKQESKSCNGRLDLMYACQYGNWQGKQ